MSDGYASYIRNIGSNIGGFVLDLVYPRGLYCISCGKITDRSCTYGLCNECMSAASWISERHCSKCGRPLAGTNPGPLCFGCTSNGYGSSHSFDKGHTCSSYSTVEQSVIFAFKYGSRSDIGEILGEILYDRMTAEYSPDELAAMYDMVIPVPIYKEKKNRRGFNHADLMAESLSKRAGLRYVPDAVTRVRATRPMKGLGPEERKANIRGAFKIKKRLLPDICGARILLVDDIYTTGATVNEISALLKQPYNGLSGASRVDFLAYAAASDKIVP